MYYYPFRSRIDGAPCVLVLTRNSDNTKTGNMVQTWILRRNVDPLRAVRTGADRSVCGTCPHRGRDARGRRRAPRTCYVTVHRAPLSVWRAYRRGSYQLWRGTPEQITRLHGRPLRIGTYGEPTALPAAWWRRLVRQLQPARITGYTHRWREYRNRGFRGLCMASADSVLDAIDATRAGWRYFRVRPCGEPALPREIVCPASEEAGHKTQCFHCGLCNGAGPRRSVVIMAHGAGKARIT